jgi:hypothetical protein
MDGDTTAYDSQLDIPPHLGLRDTLRVAYHLLLSGWEVEEAAAWLGLHPELVRNVCLHGMAPRVAA